MSLLATPGSWIDVAGGVLLAALGLFVLTVRPRRRENVALAVFALGFGLGGLLNNLYQPGDPEDRLLGPVYLALLTSTLAVGYLAYAFPRRLRGPELRLLALPAALLGGGALAQLLLTPGPLLALGLTSQIANPLGIWVNLLVAPTLGHAYGFALVLLALRFRRAAEGSRERRQFALVSAALLLYPGLYAGMVLAPPGPVAWVTDLRIVAVLSVLVALWLGNTRSGSAPERRAARHLALLALALPLAGLAITPSLGGTAVAQDSGVLGLMRVLSVLVLAYAILRHQLLGIDLKVKWTIKQSTVAAAFVGVFFVVSESASTFFSTSGLGAYLGIAAAGLLVFALAPLQRMAEKVASAAMPGVRAPSTMTTEERSAVYRDAAVQAWSDGSIDRGERALLDRLQVSLGLGRDEAMRIEQEAARP